MKLLLVLMFISVLSLSYACKCAVQPVEKYFCDSEFAIKIKVKSEIHKSDDQLQAWYEIEALDNYKTDEKTKTALSSSKLWTASESAACGRYLELNHEYIITGTVDENGKARTHSCTFGRDVNDLSDDEKQFFSKGFKSVSCSKSE